MDLFNLSKEIIILTGVSGNLGIKYAGELLKRYAVVIGIDLEKNKKIDDLKSKFPSTFLFLKCDITSKTQIEIVKQAIIKKYTFPTVLINNAAIDSPPSAPLEENGPFESYPEKSWEKIMDVNLKGVFLCCQVFGSVMALNKKGSIINISSIYGMLSPDQSIYEYKRKNGEEFYKPIGYSVSKAGIINMSRYLSSYWARTGVRVNTLTLAGVENNQDEKFIEAYTSRIPIGRMANSEDYIGPIVFLSSKASNYMTGANLVIDGGWTSI